MDYGLLTWRRVHLCILTALSSVLLEADLGSKIQTIRASVVVHI